MALVRRRGVSGLGATCAELGGQIPGGYLCSADPDTGEAVLQRVGAQPTQITVYPEGPNVCQPGDFGCGVSVPPVGFAGALPSWLAPASIALLVGALFLGGRR